VESTFEEDFRIKKSSKNAKKAPPGSKKSQPRIQRTTYRVDSYDPDRGIISRKYPSGQAFDSETGIKYITELIDKYPPGARIADTPRARQLGLAGRRLRGPPILEVPILLNDVPPDVLALAHRVGVTIRDVTGKVYE
jgi:filamentous hemagglutinin